MLKDTFISHSAADAQVARKICEELERRGVLCWIASRDIVSGANYAEALIDAINSSKTLLLVLSGAANESPHVRREVERAVNKGLEIVTFAIERVVLRKDLEFFLSIQQWQDASSGPLASDFEKLAAAVTHLSSQHKAANRAVEPKTDRGAPPQGLEIWRPKSNLPAVLRLEIARGERNSLRVALKDQLGAPIVHPISIPSTEEMQRNAAPQALQDKGQAAQCGRYLFDTCLPQDIAAILRNHQGSLVLDTEVTDIPWELLHDGAEFLNVRRVVTYLPEAFKMAQSLLGDDAMRPLLSEPKALIVADPLGTLPGASREAVQLRALFERVGLACDVLTGPADCSLANVRKRIAAHAYALLHFSLPLQFLPERGGAAVVLANGQWLTTEELCRDLRGAVVAFINGCHPAEPAAHQNDNDPNQDVECLTALARALIHGNPNGRALAVIGTAAGLSNDVACEIAPAFYSELFRGATVAETLRKARCSAAGFAQFHEWFPYVCFGDPNLAPVGLPSWPAFDEAPQPETAQDEQASHIDLSMGLPLSDEMYGAVLGAVATMTRMNWSVLSTVHMILGLTYVEGGIVYTALFESGIDPTEARRALRNELSEPPSALSGQFGVSANLTAAFEHAAEYASLQNCPKIEESHFLRALLENEANSAFGMLKAMNVDLNKLKSRVGMGNVKPPATATAPSPSVSNPAEVSDLFDDKGDLVESKFDAQALAALKLAIRIAQRDLWPDLRSPHIFIGSILRNESVIAGRLRSQGVDPILVAARISQATRRTGARNSQSVLLNRATISEAALRVLNRAHEQSKPAKSIGEEALLRSLVADPNGFVAACLTAMKIDSARLLDPNAK